MKDLGYSRVPTNLLLRVRMPGEIWLVPCQIIVDNYDEHYKSEFSDMVQAMIDRRLNETDLISWAMNNMNWSDVEPYSRCVQAPPPLEDKQAYWTSGDHQIVPGLEVEE